MRKQLLMWLGLDVMTDVWPESVEKDEALAGLRRTLLQVLRAVTFLAGIFVPSAPTGPRQS